MQAYREEFLRGLLRRGIGLEALDEVGIHLSDEKKIKELEEKVLELEKDGGKLDDEKLLEIYHNIIK